MKVNLHFTKTYNIFGRKLPRRFGHTQGASSLSLTKVLILLFSLSVIFDFVFRARTKNLRHSLPDSLARLESSTPKCHSHIERHTNTSGSYILAQQTSLIHCVSLKFRFHLRFYILSSAHTRSSDKIFHFDGLTHITCSLFVKLVYAHKPLSTLPFHSPTLGKRYFVSNDRSFTLALIPSLTLTP